ncbi:hypothetical protein Mgra_00004745 [Meloidogyne graminicola]|nr:hypothetical protein Mgra_00004745 [Meloidogyne graminicola]
MKKMKY